MAENSKAYQRFFARLKSRGVFRAAAWYGGVAFIVFQAADFVLPALRIPEVVSTAIVLLALVCFPFVLSLSWFFDLTADGWRRTEPEEEEALLAIANEPILRRWPAGVAAATGILLLLGGVGFGLRRSQGPEDPGPPSPTDRTTSLVIVPFLNLGEKEVTTFFTEGIKDEISEALMRVRGVRVFSGTDGAIPREAVDGSNGPNTKPAGSYLLEGTVRSAGDEVQVEVALADLRTPAPPWRKTFLLRQEGFLIALDGVARELAEQLLGSPLPQEQYSPLIPQWTASFPAYRDYLIGRGFSRDVTPQALESAVAAYQRAIVLDPSFTRAWSGLAMAYALLPESGGPPIPEILPYAQAAAAHALAPGEELPEGFAASGFLKWFFLWEFQDGEANLRRSIEMNPHYATARYWLARALTSQRRWAEAREEVMAALELAPQSAAAYMTLGMLLMCQGEEGAAEAFQQALELAPQMHPAAFLLGALLSMEGDLEGAAREFERFSALTGSDAHPLLAYLAALGDPSAIPEAVAALESPTFFGPAQAAALLAHLGQTGAALSLLEQGAQARSPYLLWANALPHFEGLRQDMRFRGILTWIGI